MQSKENWEKFFIVNNVKLFFFSRLVCQLELGSIGLNFLVIDPYISASCRLSAECLLMIFFIYNRSIVFRYEKSLYFPPIGILTRAFFKHHYIRSCSKSSFIFSTMYSSKTVLKFGPANPFFSQKLLLLKYFSEKFWFFFKFVFAVVLYTLKA